MSCVREGPVQSVSQSVSPYLGPPHLEKTRGPQSRDGKGSLEGTWSLSPTMIYANTLLLHQLDPKSRQIPILFKRYPSSLPSLCNELVFPDTPLASVLRRPVPIYVLALRELRQRVLPSQDWPPPASPAPDRLPIQNTPRPSPILASCHVSRPSPLPAPLFLHPVHDARLSCGICS